MRPAGPRCLFLAPLKPPDHAVPSGDRAIARNWMRVLGLLGWDMRLASTLRTFTRTPDDATMALMRSDGQAETRRILADEALIAGASLVFCYHNYYRAPDCVGPELARALGVPYVIAEPSLATKRLAGPFAAGEQRAREAVAAARLLLAATGADRPALEALLRPGQSLATLPAGLDPEIWPHAEPKRSTRLSGPFRLLAVAMMREGFKLESYALLAEALRLLPREDWVLDIHGDGPARGAVEQAFAAFGDRVRFHGQSTPARLAQAYIAADLLAWPGWREPYGMVYLEAQLHGLPCLAGRFGGVADALAPASLLVDPCTPETYAAGLGELMANPADLAERRAKVRDFVLNERSLAAMAGQFTEAARLANIALPGGERG